MHFVLRHLNELKLCLDQGGKQGAVGLSPTAWAASVGYKALPGVLSETPLRRDQVRAYCQSPERSTQDCFVTIMAWGGTALWLRFRQQAWDARSQWLDTVAELRRPGLTRADAYRMLWELKTNGNNRLPGLGPAFFTKLIFFMRAIEDGYVMDQWVAKSINLLVGMNIVEMAGETVSLKNTSEKYEQFCLAIDRLSETLGISPDATEQALFSIGGKRAGEWRKYVRDPSRH